MTFFFSEKGMVGKSIWDAFVLLCLVTVSTLQRNHEVPTDVHPLTLYQKLLPDLGTQEELKLCFNTEQAPGIELDCALLKEGINHHLCPSYSSCLLLCQEENLWCGARMPAGLSPSLALTPGSAR